MNDYKGEIFLIINYTFEYDVYFGRNCKYLIKMKNYFLLHLSKIFYLLHLGIQLYRLNII